MILEKFKQEIRQRNLVGLKENLKKEIKNMFEGGGGTIGVDLFVVGSFSLVFATTCPWFSVSFLKREREYIIYKPKYI